MQHATLTTLTRWLCHGMLLLSLFVTPSLFAEQKKQLGEAITKAAVDIVNVPADAVKVIFVDMKKDDYMEGGILRSER